jgi:hypothetical protein
MDLASLDNQENIVSRGSGHTDIPSLESRSRSASFRYMIPPELQPAGRERTCSASVRVRVLQTRPPSYLGLSLIAIVCCCWPLGLCALFHSARVNPAWKSGDRAGAQRASEAARIFSLIGIFIGALGALVAIVSIVIWLADHTGPKDPL